MIIILQTHSNETLGVVREKVAAELKSNVEQVQMVANEKVVSSSSFSTFSLQHCLYMYEEYSTYVCWCFTILCMMFRAKEVSPKPCVC
jgi:hypothetical protein